MEDVVAAIAISRHVPAFEAPGHEFRQAKRLRKSLALVRSPSVSTVSVCVRDGDVFALLQFLLTERGRASLPMEYKQLVQALYALTTTHKHAPDAAVAQQALWIHSRTNSYDIMEHRTPQTTPHPASPSSSLLALITFRPQPLLPLNMGSARRAVTFVHGYIALVTANAYISTLGGGHFLCLHLHQAKLMARLQIAISDALHDPILKSKCRINLAYNAMREGRFRRAHTIIKQEEQVATQLENDELVLICKAAQIYLTKTIKLHHEFMRKRADLSTKERAVVDNFYRQRIVRKAK